ncbi:MAG: hypothetical protein ACLQUY_06875 [Ktedonobacterales bacterium]
MLIAHYLLRAVAVATALAPTRVSFVATLRLVRDHLTAGNQLLAGCPSTFQQLIQELSAWLLPARVGRVNPRVVKQKMVNFRVKTAAHLHWPQPSMPFAEAIVLLF